MSKFIVLIIFLQGMWLHKERQQKYLKVSSEQSSASNWIQLLFKDKISSWYNWKLIIGWCSTLEYGCNLRPTQTSCCCFNCEQDSHDKIPSLNGVISVMMVKDECLWFWLQTRMTNSWKRCIAYMCSFFFFFFFFQVFAFRIVYEHFDYSEEWYDNRLKGRILVSMGKQVFFLYVRLTSPGKQFCLLFLFSD